MFFFSDYLYRFPFFFFFFFNPGFPASRVNPWARSGSMPASPGKFFSEFEGPVPALVSRWGRVVSAWRGSNPDGGCHHRPVLPLGLPRPNLLIDSDSSVFYFSFGWGSHAHKDSVKLVLRISKEMISIVIYVCIHQLKWTWLCVYIFENN